MSYFDDKVAPKSITKQVRKELAEALQSNNSIRAQLAAVTAERDALAAEREEMANQVATAKNDYVWEGKLCCGKCGEHAEDFVTKCELILAARDSRMKAEGRREGLKEAASRARKRALIPGNPAVAVLLAVAMDLEAMATTAVKP